MTNLLKRINETNVIYGIDEIYLETSESYGCNFTTTNYVLNNYQNGAYKVINKIAKIGNEIQLTTTLMIGYEKIYTYDYLAKQWIKSNR